MSRITRNLSPEVKAAQRADYEARKRIKAPETRTFRSIRAAEQRAMRRAIEEAQRRALIAGKATRR